MIQHVPVMASEVLEYWKTDATGIYLDMTFGYGGHTELLLNHFPECKVIAIDRDPQAIEFGKTVLLPRYQGRLKLLQGCFSEVSDLLQTLFPKAEMPQFSGILFDLGLSSPQIDQATRGFSFQKEGPLDMRMSQIGRSAADFVNQLPETELANLFFMFGEERHSRRIAKSLVEQRKKNPFTTTLQLAEAINNVIRYRGKIHPATRVFQALRIAVNQELPELDKALPIASSLLKHGGSLCRTIFSFSRRQNCQTFFPTYLAT